jgi:hypothetical protein
MILDSPVAMKLLEATMNRALRICEIAEVRLQNEESCFCDQSDLTGVMFLWFFLKRIINSV